jgi:AraC-like DNA-binding protein
MSVRDHSPAPAGAGEVRAGLVGSLTNFMLRYPLKSPERLFVEAGLEPGELGDPEAMLGLRALLAFLQRAVRETGDECFGVEFAAHLPWRDLGLLGYLMQHSPTLGSALENACRYFAVHQRPGELSLVRGPQTACLTYTLEAPDLGAADQQIEMIFFLIVRFCREATSNRGWAPAQVHFVHEGPISGLRHDRFFGSSVRFNRPVNALVLPAVDLELPLQKADPGLLSILRRCAEELLPGARPKESYADAVKRAVTGSLSSGKVNIEDIAAQLQTTVRNLQRRLHEGGKTYQQLLGETRLAVSQKYLEDPALSLTETALLLGYSDLSAFSRAFRKWTGMNPHTFRRNRS